MQSRWLQFFCVAVMCLGVVGLPAASQAQGKPVAADFKGAVGLGLVGAELGAVIPAIAGLDATWAYIVFPAVGAAGGAVAGYFAIDHAGHAELSVAALTVGMGLVIPALVLTLWATAYDPGSDADSAQSRPRSNDRAGLASARAPRPVSRAQRQAAAGSGMLRLSDDPWCRAAAGHAAG
jgi:hypothetical protein